MNAAQAALQGHSYQSQAVCVCVLLSQSFHDEEKENILPTFLLMSHDTCVFSPQGLLLLLLLLRPDQETFRKSW